MRRFTHYRSRRGARGQVGRAAAGATTSNWAWVTDVYDGRGLRGVTNHHYKLRGRGGVGSWVHKMWGFTSTMLKQHALTGEVGKGRKGASHLSFLLTSSALDYCPGCEKSVRP